jgi:hypothetical protein
VICLSSTSIMGVVKELLDGSFEALGNEHMRTLYPTFPTVSQNPSGVVRQPVATDGVLRMIYIYLCKFGVWRNTPAGCY